MPKWLSSLVPAVPLVACLGVVGWQAAYGHPAHFSFIFASAAFAAVSLHWLLEELELVSGDPSHLTYET
jgi:hypothetical protein